MRLFYVPLAALIAILFSTSTEAAPPVRSVVIRNNHPLIYYHGRWDKNPGTWWAGSGFKINVQGLSSLKLNLGEHTTSPVAAVGVSVDYAPFVTVNVSQGENVILPLPGSSDTDASARFGFGGAKPKNSVVRLNVQGWQNNRIHLQSLELNAGAKLIPYTPSKLVFQFIGDSLSAGVGPGDQGQFLPQGVDQAWPFLVGEEFKAEHRIVAQPGAALTDIVSYGNQHGLSYQFFRTEDTGYYWTTDHNYTTPWNFARDIPAADVVVIHLGANDNGQNVPADEFVKNYLSFLTNLRKIYWTQPILILSPWGWPNADGNVYYYYDGKYEEIVNKRRAIGDRNTFLVNTTGWVTFDDVFPDNVHPNVAGHQKIATLFSEWLEGFGIKPQRNWSTPV